MWYPFRKLIDKYKRHRWEKLLDFERCYRCNRLKKIKWRSVSRTYIIFCSKRCLKKWLRDK